MNYREGYLNITWFHQKCLVSDNNPSTVFDGLTYSDEVDLVEEYIQSLEDEIKYLKARLLRQE